MSSTAPVLSNERLLSNELLLLEELRDNNLTYPDSDGKPMADNTVQFRWIITIKEGLEALYRDREDVFVAGDLLWYPVEGRIDVRTAPDAMVVFGRPKGDRGSYMQWKEENIAPQVVFEILSPGNRSTEMERKRRFYEHFGVTEYYVYDPDKQMLEGWIKGQTYLEPIDKISGWESPLLGIRFDLEPASGLAIYRPDGSRFLTYQEVEDARIAAEQRAEQERQNAEQERQRADRFDAHLRKLGIDPDEIDA